MQPAAIHVRLNVTSEGTLIALVDGGAIVQLPVAQLTGRQTTLSIEWHGERMHLPAKVVRSVAHSEAPKAPAQYYITLEFLALPPATARRLRRLLEPDSVQTSMTAA